MGFSGYMNYAVLQVDREDNEMFIIAMTCSYNDARTLADRSACKGYVFPIIEVPFPAGQIDFEAKDDA